MFSELKGILSRKFKDSISVMVNDIGYLVQVSESTIEKFEINSRISLTLETRFKVDKIVLFGFVNDFQQFCFNTISNISGVTDRVALNISGYFSPLELIEHIKNEDINKNFKINGLGEKTWEKIIFALQRNKNFLKDCQQFISSSSGEVDNSKNINKSQIFENEAISALINIGIGKSIANDLVMKASKNLLHREDVKNLTEELVRLALSYYSNN